MSTFMGLNIGASALRTFQTAVNTTSNNIANVQTEGYTKQETNINATSALRINAKYGSVGTGVEASSITQTRNEYYDTKYWNNQSSLGIYEQKLYYLDQIQSVLADDSVTTGFSTLFANMFNALDSIITDGPSDESTRNQFINKSQQLCTYFNSVYNSLQDIQTDCNEEIKSTVDDINSISEKLMLMNKEIYAIEVRGGSANDLRDQRNSLIDELSNLTKVEVEEVPVKNSYGQDLGATTYRVYINGQTLVDGFDNRTLECTSDDYNKNQCDVDGMYDIVWSDTKMAFNATGGNAGGTLKALFQMRDGNNAEALTGTVTAATGTTDSATGIFKPESMTISDLSVTDLANLAASSKGTVTIGNYTFKYESFDMEMDAEGNISSITFNFNNADNNGLLPAGAYQELIGEGLTCGESVDAMGVPYYMTQINSFIRTFAKAFNDIESTGETLDGQQMGTYFTAENNVGTVFDYAEQLGIADGTTATVSSNGNSYFELTASTFEVNADSLKSAKYFATTADITNGTDAYDLITSLKTLQADVTMFRGDNAESFLETLLSDASVDTNKAEIFYNNFNNLSTSLDNMRTSESGVDQDEEALDLIKYQNAYNLSSKIISVLTEMYDKLIEETGVT